jgi:hypothetical protein
MIQSIEMTKDEMIEIMAALPVHLRERLEKTMQMVRPDSGIDVVRQFVDQFEEDDRVDNMLSFTCASLITGVVADIRKNIQAAKKKGLRGLDGLDVAKTLVERLHKEASKITRALSEHEEEHAECCSNH